MYVRDHAYGIPATGHAFKPADFGARCTRKEHFSHDQIDIWTIRGWRIVCAHHNICGIDVEPPWYESEPNAERRNWKRYYNRHHYRRVRNPRSSAKLTLPNGQVLDQINTILEYLVTESGQVESLLGATSIERAQVLQHLFHLQENLEDCTITRLNSMLFFSQQHFWLAIGWRLLI